MTQAERTTPAVDTPQDTIESPESITLAWQAWRVVTVICLGLVALYAISSMSAPIPSQLKEQITSAATEVNMTDGMIRGVWIVSQLFLAGLCVAVIVTWTYFAFKARRGWWTGRTLTNIGGQVLVFLGIINIMNLFFGGTGGDSAESTLPAQGTFGHFLLLALFVLAGLFAAVAMWAQHHPESNDFYFEHNPGKKPQPSED